MSNALSWWKMASTQSRRGGHRVPELGFEADEGVAPEWLPERSHDCGRQSNEAVDIGFKVTRVGDDGAWYVNLSTNSTSLLQICSDSGDGTSPNFMILVLAQLVLRPILQASAAKMANADEMSL